MIEAESHWVPPSRRGGRRSALLGFRCRRACCRAR